MTIRTRFAPSPTGYLHIGGARTALFNWLFARHHGGEFTLRIEDTDKARSTPEATQAILDGMEWLGLNWDGDTYYQSAAEPRHREVAEQLLASGHAYRCYCTPEELEQMRDDARKLGHPIRSPWRERTDAPQDVAPAIRIKAPLEGTLTIDDAVQGRVEVKAEQLDDFIILRSDGSPTYMHAVVVDDHDMGITHIIRGDDHLNNAFRQRVIYEAMGWDVPVFAHIPLIHGADGAKLSKRHGALGVDAYRDMGYLPEALRNYLLRLGWSHGDDEIISTTQAIEWFSDLSHINKAPARFDFDKLDNLNGHYIRESDDDALAALVSPLIPQLAKDTLLAAMSGLKPRAKTIKQLAESARFYMDRLPPEDDKAQQQLDGGKGILAAFTPALEAQTDWTHDALMAFAKAHAEANGLKLGALMAPVRVALTGSTGAPSLFEVMPILGKDETLARLKAA